MPSTFPGIIPTSSIILEDFFVYKNRDWKTWLAYSLDVFKLLVAYYTWKLKWVTPGLKWLQDQSFSFFHYNVMVKKIPPALFEVTEVCFWNLIKAKNECLVFQSSL